jgi:hypothetical protein
MRRSIYWSLGLALALAQLTGCQKRAPFNPALAGHFFPLRSGLTWTYQVTYPNGAHETISDRVVKADAPGTSQAGALILSEYLGHGTRAIRANLPQAYPPEMTRVETRYVVENGYISRSASLGGRTAIRLNEHDFLPQYMWPDRTWSNTLSPFDQLPDDILKVAQIHRSFLEGREVVVPAGRFSTCIRIETEASYPSPAGTHDKRYFTDWYAPDVGLVKTLVLSSGQNGHEIARIELLRFAKSDTTTPLQASQGRSLVPVPSKFLNRAAATASPRTDR